jgi:hypothetical protein
MASEDTAHRLARLRRDLEAIRRGGLARQEDIAAATAVCQETVSKAKTGHLRRWTPAMESVAQHANMLLGTLKVPGDVEHSVRAFLAAGGRHEDLVALVDKATDLVTGHR